MYLGIDPGLKQSAIVTTDMYRPLRVGIIDNDSMLDQLTNAVVTGGARAKMIIEIPICRKWSGSDISYTAIWTGRFIQAWPYPNAVRQISRSKVKGLLGCHRGGDSAVRKTLIERFDPGAYKITKAGVWVLKPEGSQWFEGFKKDIWQAYAAVVAHLDEVGGK